MNPKITRFVADRHVGQQDKQGLPYFFHLIRVAEAVPERLQHAALAHDLLEDTDTTVTEMHTAGLSREDILLVKALTKQPNQAREDYIAQIFEDGEDAITIKIADIVDNLSRVAYLDRDDQDRLTQKYRRDLCQLAGLGRTC